MLSAPRLRRADRTADAGVTLIETLVVTALMTVVGAMATAFFVGSNRATTAAMDTSTTTANGRTTMSALTQALRLADSPTQQAGYPTARFTTVSASSVVFYSNVNSDRTGSTSRSAPTKVSFTASGTKLTELLYAPLTPYPSDYTTNYPSTPTTTKVLLNNLGSTNVFSYCSATIDVTTGACTATTAGGSVASVTVNLTLTGLPGEATQSLTSTVGITGALS